MDHTAAFYMRPSYEFHGSGLPVFAGSRRQRGGSIFGSLKRFFTPIAKFVGRNLLSHGVGLAQDVASDVLAGKNVKDSFLSHGKSRATNLGKSVLKEGLSSLSNMVGQGKRRSTKSKKRPKRIKRKLKRVVPKRSTNATSRKRKKQTSIHHKRSAKKRRLNF